jgi:hypothetical protein
MGTSTSSFGVGRRESHDATDFYARFAAPQIDDDDTVGQPVGVDQIHLGDSRDMHAVPDASVALVVTSPPYFAGKEYETALGEGHVPSDYLAYLTMLRDVFAECVRVLEPGGRIAVNVANLGRRPYRNLAADVTAILQDDLRLLLRGEVIWQKQRGAIRLLRLGLVPVARQPGAPRHDRAGDRRQQGSIRPGRPTGGRCPTSRARPRSPATSSWRPPSTCGRSPPSPPPASATPRPSRSRLVERCHPPVHLRRVTSCSTRSSVRAPRPSRHGQTRAATTSATTPTPEYVQPGPRARRRPSRPKRVAIDRRTLKEAARALLDAAGLDEVEENVRVAPGVTGERCGPRSDPTVDR